MDQAQAFDATKGISTNDHSNPSMLMRLRMMAILRLRQALAQRQLQCSTSAFESQGLMNESTKDDRLRESPSSSQEIRLDAFSNPSHGDGGNDSGFSSPSGEEPAFSASRNNHVTASHVTPMNAEKGAETPALAEIPANPTSSLSIYRSLLACHDELTIGPTGSSDSPMLSESSNDDTFPNNLPPHHHGSSEDNHLNTPRVMLDLDNQPSDSGTNAPLLSDHFPVDPTTPGTVGSQYIHVQSPQFQSDLEISATRVPVNHSLTDVQLDNSRVNSAARDGSRPTETCISLSSTAHAADSLNGSSVSHDQCAGSLSYLSLDGSNRDKTEFRSPEPTTVVPQPHLIGSEVDDNDNPHQESVYITSVEFHGQDKCDSTAARHEDRVANGTPYDMATTKNTAFTHHNYGHPLLHGHFQQLYPGISSTPPTGENRCENFERSVQGDQSRPTPFHIDNTSSRGSETSRGYESLTGLTPVSTSRPSFHTPALPSHHRMVTSTPTHAWRGASPTLNPALRQDLPLLPMSGGARPAQNAAHRQDTPLLPMSGGTRPAPYPAHRQDSPLLPMSGGTRPAPYPAHRQDSPLLPMSVMATPPVAHVPVLPTFPTFPMPLTLQYQPSPSAVNITTPKKKGKRTMFTQLQLDVLNRDFACNKYPRPERLSELAMHLQLERKVVKVWFQNRRAREKKK